MLQLAFDIEVIFSEVLQHSKPKIATERTPVGTTSSAADFTKEWSFDKIIFKTAEFSFFLVCLHVN